MWSILFLLNVLLYVVLLFAVFKSKKRIDSEENKLFKVLTIIEIITLFSEVTLQLTIRTLGGEALLSVIKARIFLIEIFAWFCVFSMYTFYILRVKKIEDEELRRKKYKIIRNAINILLCVGTIVFLVLPIKIMHEGENIYSYGPAVDALKAALGTGLIVWLILLIINHKDIKQKELFPIYTVILLLILNTIIQTINPSVLIASSTMAFTLYIMFFTIENPDLKMLRETEAAKIHAEKANRAKSDFLSSMSHEIKTPLNAIVGFSEDIRDYIDSGDTARIKEDSELILASSETLLEIVGNILDISKIESERMDIIEGVYNPKEEIEKLTKITSTKIGDKPIKFNLHIAEDIPYELMGDSGKVKQIINNLLTNAIKYTDEGEINLRVDCINQKGVSVLKISCQDTGRGIKKENVEKLFNKFDRLDVEKNSTVEGTGLGLAITKNLVEMMGGNINVSSQFGKGSIFVAQIPQRIKTLHTPVSQEMPNVPATPSKKQEKIDGKILVVDDNNLNIVVAKKALEELIDNIDTALSGQECLDKINNGEKYDLILMDIMMPEMSGETTFTKLREIEGFNTPVIAVTADTEAGTKEKYISEGFIDYVAKPFKKEEIKTYLEKYLNKKETEVKDEIETL